MKHDMQRRFAFIETCIYWGVGLTASHLGKVFGIARQNAQKTINDYKTSYPGQLTYDASAKCHKPSASFKPELIKDQPNLYLDYLRGNHMVAKFWSENDWSELIVYDTDEKTRPHLDQGCIRVIISALQEQQVVKIYYHSKLHTQYLTISPNTLVYASQRYHIRAYCHDSFHFIDLNLARVLHAELATDDWVSSDEDTDWNTTVRLTFVPNRGLPEQMLNTLRKDYRLAKEDNYVVNTNLALAFYIKRNLLSMKTSEGKPLWLMEKHPTDI